MTERSDPSVTRLVVYGTLAPGEVNAGELSDLAGDWRPCRIRGRLAHAGWGAHHGFPGLVLDPDGGEVSAQLFVSDDLPAALDRLDAFEGEAYRRTAVMVETDDGPLAAQVYALADPPDADAG